MLESQNSVFIDTQNCGSSVGYYINVNEYKHKDEPVNYSISANVVLADCAHKIDWGFGEKDSVEKIDAAIAMLQEFRKKYIETQKLVSRLSK